MIRELEAYLTSQGHSRYYSSSQANEPEPQLWHKRQGFQECGRLYGVNDGEIGELFFVKGLR